jgi:hypothetical protein
MIKSLAVAAIAGGIVLGAPAVARAHWGDWGDDNDRQDHHGRAPEPATVIGLSLGVAGIVAARWGWSRRSNRKQ